MSDAKLSCMVFKCPNQRVLSLIRSSRFLLRPVLTPINSQEAEDDYGGYMVHVLDGGSVVFNGEMYATDLRNMRSVFYNEAEGSIE